MEQEQDWCDTFLEATFLDNEDVAFLVVEEADFFAEVMFLVIMVDMGRVLE